MDENKKKTLQNIEIVVLSILIIAMIVLIIYMVFIKKDNNEGVNNNNNNEISFDYNKIEKELTSELNNKTTYLESCDCSKVLDYDSVDKAKCSKKILSNDTISSFINKLKTSDKIELISTSKVCSEYTYSVFTNDTNERLLIAYAADDTSILLVGIRDNGYAFHFVGENVNEFLSSLNNDTQQSDDYVDTKVSYGTSDDVHLQYPEGIDNKNLTKNEVKPIKSINYISENEERVKIDEILTVIFKHTEEEYSSDDTFDIIYKNKKLNLDIEKKKVTQLSVEVDEETSFDVYKLGEKYLIKAKSAIGQNDWDWLLLINEDGELTWLTDEEERGLSHGLLLKVEYVSSNLKNFYQLTIEGFSESDGPDDWKPDDTILYIYKK